MLEITVTMEEAYPLCLDVLRAKLVPNLLSSPGIGKSSLARQIAENANLQLIDVRLSQADPADLNGFPSILSKDGINRKAEYVPMNMFPIKGDEVPEGKKGWLLLMDEFNSSSLSVQAASYKIILDRMVGMHELHDKVAVMVAGNLATDKAIVNRISTAMQSRLVHIPIRSCDKTWMKWADTHSIDHRVKSFLSFKPKMLHLFNPNHSDLTFPCPRTWEFVSKIIQPWKDIAISKLPVLAGTVGDGAAREFYSYCQIFNQIPTFEEILRSPREVAFGNEPSMQYALAGLVASRMEKDNADKLIPFISRLNVDFQVTTLRSAIARNPDLRNTNSVRDWVARNAAELVS